MAPYKNLGRFYRAPSNHFSECRLNGWISFWSHIFVPLGFFECILKNWKDKGINLDKENAKSKRWKYVDNFSSFKSQLEMLKILKRSNILYFYFLCSAKKKTEMSLWFIKFRYCETAKRLEKMSHLFLKLLSNVSSNWEIFSNFIVFVALWEYLNYPCILFLK